MDTPLLDPGTRSDDQELGNLESPPQVDADAYSWAGIHDLDRFFTLLYHYWRGKGLVVIATERLCNLSALAFTILSSGLLLLCIDWHALHSECIIQRSCDISQVAFYHHPFQHGAWWYRLSVSLYLVLLSCGWLWMALHAVHELHELHDVGRLLYNGAGLDDEAVQSATWAELLARVLLMQRHTRLSLTQTLDALHVVNRIMRKENYLIAMMDQNIIRFDLPWKMERGGGGGGGGGEWGEGGSKREKAVLVMKKLYRHVSRHKRRMSDDARPILNPDTVPWTTASALRAGGGGVGGVGVEGMPPPLPPPLTPLSDSSPSPSPSPSLHDPSTSSHSSSSSPSIMTAEQHVAAGRYFTRTLEWCLRFCLLDYMYLPSSSSSSSSSSSTLRPDLLNNPSLLARRFRLAAILHAMASPFLAIFLLIFFFLRNAEHFYHHPSSIGQHKWSVYGEWTLRCIHELPHQLEHRLHLAHGAAERYTSQFPSRLVAHVARLIAFVIGSFAALLLFMAVLDEDLLERPLFGRNLVFWAAAFGLLLAMSRSLSDDDAPVLIDPEASLRSVIPFLFHWPRHWRHAAHERVVRREFHSLFSLKATQFAHELCSIVMNPILLGWTLPRQSERMIQFLREHTVRREGLGDICDVGLLQSPSTKEEGSKGIGGGKVEKSMMNFVLMYPSWRPNQSIMSLLQHCGATWMEPSGGGHGGGGDGGGGGVVQWRAFPLDFPSVWSFAAWVPPITASASSSPSSHVGWNASCPSWQGMGDGWGMSMPQGQERMVASMVKMTKEVVPSFHHAPPVDGSYGSLSPVTPRVYATTTTTPNHWVTPSSTLESTAPRHLPTPPPPPPPPPPPIPTPQPLVPSSSYTPRWLHSSLMQGDGPRYPSHPTPLAPQPPPQPHPHMSIFYGTSSDDDDVPPPLDQE